MAYRLTRSTAMALAGLLGVLAPAPGVAVFRLGGVPNSGAPAVRIYDASNPVAPLLVDRTEYLLAAGPHALAHDGLFVASGSEVRLYDRQDLTSPRATWAAGATVLGLADGPERGLVLVLDQSSLRLVRFPDTGSPVVLWTYTVDLTSLQGTPGKLIVRDGDYAYLADASIPGVRVVTIDPLISPTTVATYSSGDGVVHDLSLWDTRLALVTPSALVIVDFGDRQFPVLHRRGSFATPVRAACADMNSKRAFLAIGATLLILNIEQGTRGFLGPPLDQWSAPGAIRSVRLDKAERAYVLLSDSLEILDVSPFGGR